MARKLHKVALSQVLRVLLSCTVFVMYGAMIRIYQDPAAPHDMHPGLDTCRHIRDLARHKYDGEYLLRSDVVAQISMLWSQSDCSRYAGLLSPSREKAAARAAGEAVSSERNTSSTQTGENQAERKGPFVASANPLDGFSWAAAHNPLLLGDLPIVSPASLTLSRAPGEPAISSRSDDVPSPPPRALG